MVCNECKQRAEQWAKKAMQFREVGEERLKEIFSSRKPIAVSLHADMRSFERAFSSSDLIEILENGWVIQYTRLPEEEVFLILSHIRIGEKRYRPVHLVLSAKGGTKVKVVTLYDPSQKSYMWDKSYEFRVCWCDK